MLIVVVEISDIPSDAGEYLMAVPVKDCFIPLV
jgi:hypothetical protein